MFKNFILKQMVKRQMKGVPEAEQERILKIVEENPDLFMKIANEVKEKTDKGIGQQDAMMAVMKSHENELRGILGK